MKVKREIKEILKAKVKREIDDKLKEDNIAIEMKEADDLYHLMTHQFDFKASDGKQLNGHNFRLSLSPEKAEELRQKLTSALESKK